VSVRGESDVEYISISGVSLHMVLVKLGVVCGFNSVRKNIYQAMKSFVT